MNSSSIHGSTRFSHFCAKLVNAFGQDERMISAQTYLERTSSIKSYEQRWSGDRVSQKAGRLRATNADSALLTACTRMGKLALPESA